jgi:hypothetical protein
MKKALISVLVMSAALGLAACNKVSGPNESSSTTKTVKTSSSHQSKASSKVASSSSSVDASKHPYGNDSQGSYWTTQQDAELQAFMASWQQSMGQSFKGTYDGKVVDYLGFEYPTVIDKTWREEVVYDQSAQLLWNHANGDPQHSRFRVVAAAVGGKADSYWPMLYLFAFDSLDMSPVVLVSQTTNGGTLWLYETGNAELRNGFAKIMQENPKIRSFTGKTDGWTKATAIDYMTHLDSKDPALQAAVTASSDDPGPDWNKATFVDHGRTGQLVGAEGGIWSLTHTTGGRTAIVERIPDQDTPAVVFYASDSDHLVTSGYHNGEPIVSRNTNSD